MIFSEKRPGRRCSKCPKSMKKKRNIAGSFSMKSTGNLTLSLRGSDLSCKLCGSELLKPREKNSSYQDAVLVCSSCGAAEGFDSFIPRAIEAALEADAYISMKDGGESPYVSCPECGLDTYVVQEIAVLHAAKARRQPA